MKGLAAWPVTQPGLVLVYIAGAATGVRMPVWQWVALGVATWAALVPFVPVGFALGFLGTTESVQAAFVARVVGFRRASRRFRGQVQPWPLRSRAATSSNRRGSSTAPSRRMSCSPTSSTRSRRT